MSNRWKASLYAAAVVLALAGGAGCGTAAGGPGPNAAPLTTPPGASPDASVPPTDSPAPPAPPQPAPPQPPAWPTPEDCVSYDPTGLTVHYEAGIYSVNEGARVVLRVSGGPGETVGDKGLALAQRYRKHCFLGRDNTREERNSYIFDYWRNPSGQTPTIPDQEEDCSGYDRHNLTVEDMGDGHGWRVKDHDHILHLFDNESDARAGKLVLSKYGQICSIGDGDDDPQVVSYFP